MLILDVQALGTQVRQCRKELGLSQLDAAGLCGVGERFLSELERGKPTVQLGKVLQVIRRLGLRMAVEQP